MTRGACTLNWFLKTLSVCDALALDSLLDPAIMISGRDSRSRACHPNQFTWVHAIRTSLRGQFSSLHREHIQFAPTIPFLCKARTAAVLAQGTLFLRSFPFVSGMLSWFSNSFWHFWIHNCRDRDTSNYFATPWSSWNIDTIRRGGSSYRS
jgi:hypothetical protein